MPSASKTAQRKRRARDGISAFKSHNRRAPRKEASRATTREDVSTPTTFSSILRSEINQLWALRAQEATAGSRRARRQLAKTLPSMFEPERGRVKEGERTYEEVSSSDLLLIRSQRKYCCHCQGRSRKTTNHNSFRTTRGVHRGARASNRSECRRGLGHIRGNERGRNS